MDDQGIFILLAVAFWIFRAVFSKKDDKKKPKRRRKRPQSENSAPRKSFTEILEELAEQAENANKPRQRETIKERKPIAKVAPKPKQESLDWQQVSTSKFKTKKQLIRHEDYHEVHDLAEDLKPIEEVETIANTEGQVFYFDKDSIDWKKAIITKEILDRKYV